MNSCQAMLQRQVDWYHQVTIYLLNRAENLPVAIKDLIRAETSKRRKEYAPPRGEIEIDPPSEPTSDLAIQSGETVAS